MGVYVSDYFLAGLPIESWHQQTHIHNHNKHIHSCQSKQNNYQESEFEYFPKTP